MNNGPTAQYGRMLNPGFCCMVCASIVEGAEGTESVFGRQREGVPFITLFLLAPMVLRRRTAKLLAACSTGSDLFSFVRKYPDAIVNLESDISITSSFVRSGIGVALSRGVLLFDANLFTLQSVSAVTRNRSRLEEILSEDDVSRISAAMTLGTWIRSLSTWQVCDALSIRPTWIQNQKQSDHASSLKLADRRALEPAS